MRNPNVPIIPGYVPHREGPIDNREFRRLLRLPRRKRSSLDRAQVDMLTRIVFPYWQNYLRAITHPFDEAQILRLGCSWLERVESLDPKIAKILHVRLRSCISLDLVAEKILFQIEVCRHGLPHQCLIIHEGRGRFEIAFNNPECDGTPH